MVLKRMESVEQKKKPRIPIFIVAYNAEKTIQDVLKRIKLNPAEFEVEILVIDDASSDSTFERALKQCKRYTQYKVTILQNPINQGYGGNQKLGYQYAINHDFDIVILLHGDGQYAPEYINDLIRPIINQKADVVLGSRMLSKGEALRGGMPFYKFMGNKILSKLQNFLLNTQLSEFHSGYRVYAVSALKKIHFEFNTNDFHFDTQIIIQLIAAKTKIAELPIPTYYGDEICYVNGFKYAWDVIRSTFSYCFHKRGILYKYNYDVDIDDSIYSPKIDFRSSHTMAIHSVSEHSSVFDIGCGPGSTIADILTFKKFCIVYALDRSRPRNIKTYKKFFQVDLDSEELPDQISNVDYVLILDILEHLKNPEQFLLHLREKCHIHTKILVTVPNVAFLPVRMMLFLGRFNYGKAGILDKTHTRLFTYSSFVRIFKQSGFVVKKVRGIPAPFAKALGNNWISKILSNINQFFIFLKKRLFSYQFFAEVHPLPVVQAILEETLKKSELRTRSIDQKKGNKGNTAK